MLHEAGNLSDLPPGSIISVKINKLELLIANLNGSVYAVDNRCPHMGGDLSKGKLEGHIVTCPLHGSQFDVTTGALVRWLKGSGLIATIGKVIKSPSSLRTYPVVLDGNRIMVDIIEPEAQARVPDLPAAEIKNFT